MIKDEVDEIHAIAKTAGWDDDDALMKKCSVKTNPQIQRLITAYKECTYPYHQLHLHLHIHLSASTLICTYCIPHYITQIYTMMNSRREVSSPFAPYTTRPSSLFQLVLVSSVITKQMIKNKSVITTQMIKNKFS